MGKAQAAKYDSLYLLLILLIAPKNLIFSLQSLQKDTYILTMRQRMIQNLFAFFLKPFILKQRQIMYMQKACEESFCRRICTKRNKEYVKNMEEG